MLNLAQYKNPALQFSGGKDSLACLYLLRDKLADLTVYWCDTGDGCPETRAVVDDVRAWIPRFEVVQSDVTQWRQCYGFPSDLVPSNNHQIGTHYGLSAVKLTNRWDCCWSNLMLPLHNRMVSDGVDAVIRGTKRCDTGTIPAEGRHPSVPYDIILPLRDWSHQDVFDFLVASGAPHNPVYDYFEGGSAPECMGCTAWWNDGKAQYFRAMHPERAAAYMLSLHTILGATLTQLATLHSELYALTKR